MEHRLRGAVAIAFAMLAIGGLAGCADSADDAPSHSDVTYDVSAVGGDIADVEYYLIDGPNGAVSYPEEVDAPTWTKSVDGGSAPTVTVTPEDDDVTVRCLIRDGSTDEILDEAEGAPGEAVTCSATITG